MTPLKNLGKPLNCRPSITRRRQFCLGAFITGAGGTLLLHTTSGAGETDIAARAAEIGRRHGLRLDFGDPADFYTPPFGPADARIPGGEAEPASITDLGPALDGIAVSLTVYPPGFFARFCHAIFLCGPLRFAGARAGGTYGPAWIILAADPIVGEGGIRETARLGVHHEFSSLVFSQIPGLETRWAALLPHGWSPILRVEDALRQAGREDAQDGFLSSYAETSIENDFNTYAETAFGNPRKLAALAETLPVVGHKAALLLRAYIALDGRLATTFQNLGLGELIYRETSDAVPFSGKPLRVPRPGF